MCARREDGSMREVIPRELKSAVIERRRRIFLLTSPPGAIASPSRFALSFRYSEMDFEFFIWFDEGANFLRFATGRDGKKVENRFFCLQSCRLRRNVRQQRTFLLSFERFGRTQPQRNRSPGDIFIGRSFDALKFIRKKYANRNPRSVDARRRKNSRA